MLKIVLDVREKNLIREMNVKCRAGAGDAELSLEVQQLNLGDVLLYSGSNLLAVIERKTVQDLESSIRDGRYREQCSRLKSLPIEDRKVIILVEGNYSTHVPSRFGRGLPKESLVGAQISMWFREGFTVVNTWDVQMTALYIECAIRKIHRLTMENKESATRLLPTPALMPTPQSTRTPENAVLMILCQVPGISTKTALAIQAHFPSIKTLLDKLEENPQCLDAVMLTSGTKTRALPKNCKTNIKLYLGVAT